MNKEKRNRLIFTRSKEGMKQEEIGRLYGLKQSAVSRIIKSCREGNFSLTEETRGVKPKLTKVELEQLPNLLQTNKATAYGYSADIWNKWSVQKLIEQEFGVHYHENYIHEIMRKIKYSSQKPIKQDYRQDEGKVAKYKTEKIPAIKKGL